MTKLTANIIVCVSSLLILCGALNNEVNAADGAKAGTLSMKQQHETMEALDRQWTKVRDAVTKGDRETASRGIAFMERKLVPDTAKLRPHRNPEKRDQYIRFHEEFVGSLKRLQTAVATEDGLRAAPELVKAVEGSCEKCHDMFAGGHH